MSEPQPFTTLRAIALPAYGPTAFSSLGTGAILPVLALSARDLGAGVAVAALIVGLIGVGQLLADLPAGALAARIGEQQALRLACLGEAVALVGCWLAPSVWLLASCVFGLGVAGAVLGLARQAYLTEAVPVRLRARALSTLGGVHRIGIFIGPFVGSAAVAGWGLGAAYLVAATGALAALVILLVTPDLAAGHSSAGRPHQARVLSVIARHRRVLVTLGLGVLVLAAVRAARNAILPLWGEAIGLDAATTSLVFGISGAVDMLLFYPAGAVMDRWGRVLVAVPSLVVLGAGFAVLPLTDGFWTLTAVGCVLGVGNGISAGIIMTLGADASPQVGRAQFLAGWRLMADAGTALGPVLIAGVSAIASIALAAPVLAGLAWLGAGWLRVWVPAYDPISRGDSEGPQTPGA
ncbi:MAG: MFS transporter [Actinomycetales bacterium]